MSEGVFDVEVQQKIVALMVQDRAFLAQSHELLKPFYFDSELLVDLVRETLAYFKKYRTPPTKLVMLQTISNMFEVHPRHNQEEYAKVITQIYKDSLPEREYLADQVFEFVQFQAVRNVLIDGVELLKRKDFDKIKALMDKAMKITQVKDSGHDYFDPETIYDRIMYEEGSKVSTGLPEIDKQIGGGLGAGELGIFLGAPNVGKSIMLTIAGGGALACGKKVLHITMEMAARKVGLRYDSHLLGKSKQALRDSVDSVSEFLQQYHRNLKANLHIKQWPTRGATVGDIRSYIEHLKSNSFHPDVLLVDYAAIMKPSSVREGRHQEIEEINEELRGLGGELEIPVWTVAQTNKNGVNKPVLTIEDLGESFAQSKVADVILAICQTKAEYEDKVWRLYTAKNRDDAKFANVRYMVSYETMRLQYAPDASQ